MKIWSSELRYLVLVSQVVTNVSEEPVDSSTTRKAMALGSFEMLAITHKIISLWLYSHCEPWPLFQFTDLYTVGRTPWAWDQPVARPLPIHRTTWTQNKSTQTSTSRVAFEPMIPVFERAKAVHVSDGAATVMGTHETSLNNYLEKNKYSKLIYFLRERQYLSPHSSQIIDCSSHVGSVLLGNV
jgi:hypothetical protein